MSSSSTSSWRSRGRWSLSASTQRGNTSTGSSSSEQDDGTPDSEYVFERDEELDVLKVYHLTVNGERARSKRTGNAFDKPVVGVRRRDDMVEFTMEDGKYVKLPVADADMEDLSQQFRDTGSSKNFSLDDLQPLFHSTPKPLAEQRRKRQKTQGSRLNVNAEGKLRGVVEVPLSRIKKAPIGLMLVGRSHARVETFKKLIRTNDSFHLPVLPVMVLEGWQQENSDEADYQLLGGVNIFEALLDISSEERYSCYRRVLVRVHQGLTAMEAMQAGALFQQEQSLLVDEAPTLQARVQICRRVLYTMHHVDETEEPPSNVDLEWRPQAAAAIGVIASSRKELKPLESTFQLAMYSKRCYEKLLRLFSWHEELHGKPMKQSMFVFLQGLSEDDKFNLLSKVVNGTIKLDQVKLEAARLKRQNAIRHAFMSLTNNESWEECCTEFPEHTKSSFLDHFLDMDFKRSVPVEFINYVKEAQHYAESGSGSFENLEVNPVRLAILQVDSKEVQKCILKNLQNGTTHLAVIAEGLDLAASWQNAIHKHGFHLLQETAIIKDTHVCHLITATNATDKPELPKILYEDDAYRAVLEALSQEGENVGVYGENKELRNEAESLGRPVTLIRQGGRLGLTINPPQDDDPTQLR